MNRTVRRGHESVRPPGAVRARSKSLVTLVLGLPLSLGLALVGVAAPAAALPTIKGYTPLTPVRICDTRAVGPGVVQNQCEGPAGQPGKLGVGAINVVVAGANTVPITAVAVVLNVTVADTTTDGFLTVWPKGLTRPTASNLNWAAGETVPNLVEVGLGANGSVSVFNSAGATNVIIDLEGYVDAAAPGLFYPLAPQRICDSRGAVAGVVAVNQCEKPGGAANTLGVGKIVVAVSGLAGVPVAATAVVLNVTVTNPSTAGFLTVWPDGATQPLASNLNWAAGRNVPNRVIVPLGTGGKIDVYNAVGSTDLIIDVNGYYSAAPGGAGLRVYSPTRVCDTRAFALVNPCNDPQFGPPAPLGAMEELTLTGPTDAVAAVFNVTVTNTTASSWLTAFPTPDPLHFVSPPTISDLNWVPGQTKANLVVVAAGTTFTVAFYNQAGTTDVIVDVEGDYTTAATAAAVRSTSVSLRHRAGNSTS